MRSMSSASVPSSVSQVAPPISSGRAIFVRCASITMLRATRNIQGRTAIPSPSARFCLFQQRSSVSWMTSSVRWVSPFSMRSTYV
ncbi:hypothetical protein SHIRM173S_13313 [Streptomyces hirsutus]